MAPGRSSARTPKPSAKQTANNQPITPAATSRKRKASTTAISRPNARNESQATQPLSQPDPGRSAEDLNEQIEGDTDGDESDGEDCSEDDELPPNPLQSNTQPEVIDLEGEEPLQRSQLRYTAVWQCLDQKKVTHGHDTRDCSGDEDAWSKAQFQAALWSPEQYSVKRINALVYHSGMKQSQWYIKEIGAKADYEQCIDKAMTYLASHQSGIHIDLKIYLDKDPPPPSTQPPPSTSRTTATSRQEAQAGATIAEFEARGDYSVSIRAHWVCSIASCLNHKKGAYCWWRGVSSANSHMPINAQALQQWTKDIKDNKASIDIPTVETVLHMADAKERLKSQSYSHKKAAQEEHKAAYTAGTTIQQFFGVMPPGIGSVQQPSYASYSSIEPQALQPPSSQPTVTPPLELIDEFFDWSKKQVGWTSLAMVLDDMKVRWIAEGYDLEGIEKINEIDWKAMDLKVGYRVRVIRSIVKFKTERRG